MESVIARFFFHNWQRKLVAILTAVIIWLFVDHSISETKTISNIPIRIVNLPADKTIRGLLPNGMLSRRIALTLTGSKDVIDNLEASDLEVLLDASTATSDEWIVEVTKKNLVSLNPSIDLVHHISQVEHSDFIIKLSRMVTAKVPVRVIKPMPPPPAGYEYLDIWPQYFTQTVTGPQEEVQQLKDKGLQLIFDLRDISATDLDAIKSASHNDEVSFPVPKKWKLIAIPFRNNMLEELNDPEAQNMRIDFLRQEILSLDKEIPVRIFYPLDQLEKNNPLTFPLATNDDIIKKNDIHIFTRPLFVKEVSRLFVDVVRDAIEIVIAAAPKNERNNLAWSVSFINPRELEDTYVAFSIANSTVGKSNYGDIPKKKEELLRKRFREYMRRMALYLSEDKKLHLKNVFEDGQVHVTPY